MDKKNKMLKSTPTVNYICNKSSSLSIPCHLIAPKSEIKLKRNI